MKKNIWRAVCIVLVLGWMTMIFGFSAQTGDESGGLSAMIAEPVTKILAGCQDALSDQEYDRLYQKVDNAVRTAAHFAEYAVLGILLKLLFGTFGIRRIIPPCLVGGLYALTDEWHQSFMPGRVCDAADVLIDACGVITGVVICKMLNHKWRKTHVHDQRTV